MKTVAEYIKENWQNTVRQKEQGRGSVKLVKPFTVPSIKDGFCDFYYWDTYFTNIGLMLDGFSAQAENNLDNMAHLIDKVGYMPNANTIIGRTQPPLFVRGVFDLYEHKKDKAVIEKYRAAMIKEMQFFYNDRTFDNGISYYAHSTTRQDILNHYGLSGRVGEFKESEEEKFRLSKNLVAIAESGWDFTPRFIGKESRFSADEYYHLDLNCILYDAESKLSQMLSLIDDQNAKVFSERAENRKNLINKFFINPKDGVYYDYNFKEKTFSPILSCASFYPFALGVSTDKTSAKKALERLEGEFGVAACENRGKDDYLQWDYPSMWAPLIYFTFNALKNCGLIEDANRVAKKYINTLDSCYQKTNSLWEKYSVIDGGVAYSKEYETPQMMGWTAGTYRYLQEQIK